MSMVFVRPALTVNHIAVPENQNVVGEVTVCSTCSALVLVARNSEHQDWHDTQSQ